MSVSSSIDFDPVGELTVGWSGADLAVLMQQAGWNAAEDRRTEISQEDVAIALEDLLLQRRRIASEGQL
jgi:ATP-dependent 26S proteasome regulatory subunit